jgi:hypothetical protein
VSPYQEDAVSEKLKDLVASLAEGRNRMEQIRVDHHDLVTTIESTGAERPGWLSKAESITSLLTGDELLVPLDNAIRGLARAAFRTTLREDATAQESQGPNEYTKLGEVPDGPIDLRGHTAGEIFSRAWGQMPPNTARTMTAEDAAANPIGTPIETTRPVTGAGAQP